MKKFLSLGVIIIVGMLLANCSHIMSKDSYYSKREKKYLQSENAKVLEIPPGLSTDQISQQYILSDAKVVGETSDLPPGL